MKNKLSYNVIRIILGLAWIFFGAGKFLPAGDPGLPEAATAFLNAMGATGYFIPFVGVAEVLGGVLLLVGFWVPFALILISAVMLNVILFNLFLAPSIVGAIMLLVLLTLQGYLMWYTRRHYIPLFQKVRKIN